MEDRGWTSAGSEHALEAPRPGPGDRRRPALVRRGAGVPIERAELVALVAVLIAFVVGAVCAVRSGWVPISDEALLELRVRDVPSHLPLVGVYSRFGWNHPGPLQFWLLAVPYRLAGSSSVALLVATMCGHLVALLGAWWLARRIDLLAGWTVLLSLLVVLATTPADLIRTPWNPYVALVAAGALLVAAWAVAERDAWGVVAFVVLASLLVQAHVVTLPVAAVLAVTAAVLLCWPRRDQAAVPVPRRAIVWSLVLLVVLWIGPILDLFVGDPSNSNLLRSDTEGPREGLAHGLGLLTREFSWWPAWARPAVVTQILVESGWTVPWWLVVPVAGAVVAVRHRDRRFVHGGVLTAAALVGVVATTALLTGGLFNYLIVEYRSLIAVVLAIGVAALLQLLPDAHRGRVSIGAAAAVVALCLVFGVRQVQGENPQSGYEPTVRSLTEAVEAGAGDGTSFVISSASDFRASEIASAMLLQLERDGHRVATDEPDPRKFGRHRVAVPGTGDVELFVAPVDSAEGLEADGWSVVQVFQPQSRADQARIATLSARRDELSAGLAPDAATVDRPALIAEIEALSNEIDALEYGRIPMLVAARPVPG